MIRLSSSLGNGHGGEGEDLFSFCEKSVSEARRQSDYRVQCWRLVTSVTVYVLGVGHTGSKPVYIIFGLDETYALDADGVRQLCTIDAQGIECIPSPSKQKGQSRALMITVSKCFDVSPSQKHLDSKSTAPVGLEDCCQHKHNGYHENPSLRNMFH